METILSILLIAAKIAEDKEPVEIAYIASLYAQLAETLDTLAIQQEYYEHMDYDLNRII